MVKKLEVKIYCKDARDMSELKNNCLKLAIQKEGRLTSETLNFLWKCGFEFESYKQKLFSFS